MLFFWSIFDLSKHIVQQKFNFKKTRVSKRQTSSKTTSVAKASSSVSHYLLIFVFQEKGHSHKNILFNVTYKINFERNKVLPHRLFCPSISKRRWNIIVWISKNTAVAIMASSSVSKLPSCYFLSTHRKWPVMSNKPKSGKNSTTDPVIHDVH